MTQSAPMPNAPIADRPNTMQAAVVSGFATTIATWIVWWLTHLPGTETPVQIAAALLTATLIAGLTIVARTSASPFRTAVVGGLISGALNLLILGSVLGVQADTAEAMSTEANRFRAEAPSIILGYLLVTALAGVIAGGLAASFRASPDPRPGLWLGRFASIVVVSFIPLLLVGGAVTGTESGMAVPDSVTSFGAFSALLPMSMMAEPRVFLEHTHRLFGTLVGLNAIALVVFAFAKEPRKAPKIFSLVLLALVIAQGVFGAMRVGANSPALAALHGVFAQIVLAFAVITACKLSPLDRSQPGAIDERTANAARKGVKISHFAASAILIQLVFGALGRHLPNGSHAVWSHAGFSIVVVILTVIAAARLRSATRDSTEGRLLRRTGMLLTLGIYGQFVLGFMTLWQVGVGGADPIPTADQIATAPRIDVLEAVISTAHQTIGASLFALMALAVYWTKRITKTHDRA